MPYSSYPASGLWTCGGERAPVGGRQRRRGSPCRGSTRGAAGRGGTDGGPRRWGDPDGNLSTTSTSQTSAPDERRRWWVDECAIKSNHVGHVICNLTYLWDNLTFTVFTFPPDVWYKTSHRKQLCNWTIRQSLNPHQSKWNLFVKLLLRAKEEKRNCTEVIF